MTDPQLERKVRAWYAPEVDDDHEAAPPELREAVSAIPSSDRGPQQRAGRGGGLTFLAAAALLIAGLAVAGSAGGFRPAPVASPSPTETAVESSDPSSIASPSVTPAPDDTASTGPTPVPTPSGALASGFSWTGAPSSIPPSSSAPIAGETATLLEDGTVLITAGCTTAAEIYDPTTDAFIRTGDLTVIRAGKTATLLQDGRVLFAGGYNCAAAGEDGTIASAEIYDPATGEFTPTGGMRDPRQNHTATLLDDGRVLIAGGYSAPPATASGIILASIRTAETSSSVLATAEVYDPATGTFGPTGSMSTFRDHHTATLLDDGRVLVVGGGGEGYASSTSADVYEPATGTFTETGPMHTGRWLHTATRLDDGRVLILGGRSPQDSVYDSAEVYDPATGAFVDAGVMTEGRQQQTATLLDDGRVLIVGGYWSDGRDYRVLSSAELYDPATSTFEAIGPIGTPREDAVATRLSDGRVLIVGGIDIGDIGAEPVPFGLVYQP